MRTVKKCKEILEEYKYGKIKNGSLDEENLKNFYESEELALKAYQILFPENILSESEQNIRKMMFIKLLITNDNKEQNFAKPKDRCIEILNEIREIETENNECDDEFLKSLNLSEKAVLEAFDVLYPSICSPDQNLRMCMMSKILLPNNDF